MPSDAQGHRRRSWAGKPQQSVAPPIRKTRRIETSVGRLAHLLYCDRCGQKVKACRCPK